MRRLLSFFALVAGTCAVQAQAPATQTAAQQPAPQIVTQQQLTVTADNPLPETTVVPVMQPVTRVGMQTVVEESPSDRHLSREERRALKVRRFAEQVDSLVQSRNYIFWPNSMQQVPGGTFHLIYNGYYYFALFTDHVEVHLPTERGITPYVEVLNFDSMSLKEYTAAAIHGGWNVRFRITDGDACYVVDFVVSTVTGETILNLLTPTTSMRYVGTILERDRHFRPARQ